MATRRFHKISIPLYIEVQTDEFETTSEELQELFMRVLMEVDDGRRDFGAEMLTHGAQQMLKYVGWLLADKEVIRRNVEPPIGAAIEEVIKNTRVHVQHHDPYWHSAGVKDYESDNTEVEY